MGISKKHGSFLMDRRAKTDTDQAFVKLGQEKGWLDVLQLHT